jgi:hypothetical protein
MRRKHRLLLGLCLGVSIAGCGGSVQVETVTVTGSPQSTTPAASSNTEPDPAIEARQRAEAVKRARARAIASVVRDYYGDLDSKRLEAAWSRLSPAVRAHLGGYAMWSEGQTGTTAVTVTSVHTDRVSTTSASVAVALRTTSVDVCSRTVHQTFAGTWTLARHSGHWVATNLHIEKTGGGTERSDYSECDAAGANSGSPETAPDYVPDDSDVPVDPDVPSAGSDDSSFCDIHDCIPNFDNGNGSVVQCEDGTYSHSGGIQGACSHHGGVG